MNRYIKVFFCIFILVITIFSFCGCNADDNASNSATEIEASTEVETIVKSVETPVKKTEVKLNEKIVKENICEYSFEKYNWAYDLTVPYLSDSTLEIAEAKADTILLYIKINVKNLSTNSMSYYDYYNWQSSLKYDGKYNYTPYIISDDFSLGKLSPLMSGNIYIVYELPESFKTDGKSITIDMNIYDSEYTMTIREEKEASSAENELKINEQRIIANQGEITFEGVRFTKSIYPKSPGYLYSVYEASNGNKYFVSEFTVKNNGEYEIHANDLFDGTIIIGDEKFPGICILGNASNSDISSSYALEMSAKRTAYFVAEVPEDIAEKGGSANFIIFNERFVINF